MVTSSYYQDVECTYYSKDRFALFAPYYYEDDYQLAVDDPSFSLGEAVITTLWGYQNEEGDCEVWLVDYENYYYPEKYYVDESGVYVPSVYFTAYDNWYNSIEAENGEYFYYGYGDYSDDYEVCGYQLSIKMTKPLEGQRPFGYALWAGSRNLLSCEPYCYA